jgi:hypothetical protein
MRTSLAVQKSQSGKSANSGSAGSTVTDYRAVDLFINNRRRIFSAIAFIKSGGTLFPIRAPRLPTSRIAV